MFQTLVSESNVLHWNIDIGVLFFCLFFVILFEFNHFVKIKVAVHLRLEYSY